MHRRPLRRATILAITGVLVFAGTAFADQLLADGDLVTTGIQGTKFLGTVAAGAEVSADVQFTLTCTGLNHVDLGQSVVLSWSDMGSVPFDGAIVSVSSATVGPATEAWAGDATGCPDPVPSMTGPTLSHVTLRAPTTSGFHMFTIVYDRAVSPAGNLDGSTFSRSATQVSFSLNVPANTPPTLTVPLSHEEEGNTTGGWIADWSGVSATDPEDNPDPTPSCLPAAGTKLLLDTTTHVVCSVTDSAGASASGAFDVTVVDTTAPVLAGMPGDQSLTTSDPGGAVATYSSPTASDIVDPSPAVACSPASGSTFGVGVTTVTCTATDASGNSSSASFTVDVRYVAANTPPTLTVPASFQVEGNTTGGWTAAWGGVSAIDVEDNPDPTPSCSPAAGTVLLVGTTTHVTCSVTDSAGASASGGFDVTVVDTTAPVLAGMPGDQSLTTSDPRGAIATYSSPTASDIVDPSPTVACSRASGSTFDVGLTTVTCTATDARGRSSSASFTVDVRFVAPDTASAIWLEPVGGGQDAFEANHSRTIPVKVRLFVDGVERSSGQALLTLTPCGGGPAALELPMTWNGARWNAALDTSMLPGPCYTVSASIDGLVAGSFRLELRGDTVAAKARSTQASSTPPTKAGHLKRR